MKYSRVAVLLLATTAILRAQQTPNVADLVAKNIQAQGGAEALRALQSVKLTGKQLVNEGKIELGYAEIKKRPEFVRVEATMQGLTGVQAYDGAEGWQISPFRGRKDPEKMSADDAKELAEEAEIGGPLFDWQAKGSTVEYLGTEDVDGTQAHKLRVVRKNGDITFVYLDPDAFLEIREVTQRTQHGAQSEVETDFGDYERVAGVFLPMSIDEGRKGSKNKQKTIFEKAEPNVPLDDALFHFPAGK